MTKLLALFPRSTRNESVRVLGTWIAASAMMVLALRLAP
jgi:hypothetical protein